MGPYSIWPYFAGMALLLSFASTPLFRAADVPPNPRGPRISTLDGLRGFLALGVFFHHAAIYHRYLSDGAWQPPPSQFYTLTGQCGVAMFFMITGYLFWSRLIAEGGRPDWMQLYMGRVFRVGPLYLFAIAVAVVIVFARSQWKLHVPALQLARGLVRWLSLGLLHPYDLNGYHNTMLLLAGVIWTLRFEWYFYLSLPALALVAARSRLHLPFAAGALVLSLAYLVVYPQQAQTAPASVCTALFLVGMTCGSLGRLGWSARLPDALASAIVGLLMGTVFIVCDSGYTVSAAILLGGAFYLIASGCTVFGVLASRPARRLGDVSYGIYLLQGLVLTEVFSIDDIREIARGSSIGHWSMMLLCAILLITIATLTHVGIERTGIELGKSIGRAVKILSADGRFARR
jgi:peptidoglycan/LPS O-acetylase OafA/YrhL